MSDPFHSSKYCIQRAKHHVDDIERQIAEFLKSDPYAFVDEIHPGGVHELHKFKLVKPMPVALPGIASDAVNNLRSALDHAVNAIAALKGKRANFPFGDTEIDFENSVKGRCKHLPQEIVDLVRTFKPYKGGNSALWALNKMCNANKHAVIRPIATATVVDFNVAFFTGGSITLDPAPIWDRTKDEMIFATQSVGSTMQGKFQVATFVAICDVEFVDGKPAHAVLSEFGRIALGICKAIEAEAKRIGLIT